MAGATTRADYVSDNGSTYTTRYPTWLFNLFTAPTTASVLTMPRGMKKRRRYAKVTASGKEHSYPVWSAADALYTSAYGTAITTEIGVTPAATGFPSTAQGRTGEKSKNI
jgi:hypothetical protein